MAKNILVLTGSPRCGGNSDRMADAFIRGAQTAGHTVTKISTAQLHVQGCAGLRRLLCRAGSPLLP